MPQSFFSNITVIILTVLVAGCQHTPPKPRQPLDNLNRVEQKYQHFFLNWSADQSSPPEREIEALIRFLKPYQGHESAHLYVEQSSTHSTAQEQWLMQSLREYCQLSHAQLHLIPATKTHKRLGFKMHIESYTVQLPNCAVEPWEFGKVDTRRMPTLGCSSNANLGAMIVDPRDLVRGSSNNKPAQRAEPLIKNINEIYGNKFAPFSSKSGSSTNTASTSSNGSTSGSTGSNTSSTTGSSSTVSGQ